MIQMKQIVARCTRDGKVKKTVKSVKSVDKRKMKSTDNRTLHLR